MGVIINTFILTVFLSSFKLLVQNVVEFVCRFCILLHLKSILVICNKIILDVFVLTLPPSVFFKIALLIFGLSSPTFLLLEYSVGHMCLFLMFQMCGVQQQRSVWREALGKAMMLWVNMSVFMRGLSLTDTQGLTFFYV